MVWMMAAIPLWIAFACMVVIAFAFIEITIEITITQRRIGGRVMDPLFFIFAIAMTVISCVVASMFAMAAIIVGGW